MKNMKKIFTLSALALVANLAFAGDGENDIKNVRFGLKITPSVNWLKPDGKIIAPNGAGVKFGGGLMLEFRLAKVASIQTGIQLDLDGGKVKYNNGGISTPGSNWVSYYYSKADDEIVEYNSVDSSAASQAKYEHYQLNERQYKITYITIPLTLKLKTKEIGMFTYYGQLGVNSSFRWKAKATDKVTSVNTNANETKTNVNITKDVSVIRETLNLGLGAEMNLSGSTSLTFGLNYLLGFTNVVKSKSDYTFKRTNDPSGSGYTLTELPQALKSNAVVLTIGVLF